MRRPEFIAQQARRPSGTLGWLIGKIMSHETSSLNDAVLDALAIQRTDRVLEVGFGHGRTIRRAAEAASAGLVAGVDFSETMLAMATRTCRRLIAEGRVKLELADSARLPFPDEHFDKAYAVHTLYFWENPADHLREIRRVLRPGGRFALGFRTKQDGSRAESFPATVYTFYSVEDARGLLRASGFASEVMQASTRVANGMVVLVAEKISQEDESSSAARPSRTEGTRATTSSDLVER
jgi:SAM-dependent methyltransferase